MDARQVVGLRQGAKIRPIDDFSLYGHHSSSQTAESPARLHVIIESAFAHCDLELSDVMRCRRRRRRAGWPRWSDIDPAFFDILCISCKPRQAPMLPSRSCPRCSNRLLSRSLGLCAPGTSRALFSHLSGDVAAAAHTWAELGEGMFFLLEPSEPDSVGRFSSGFVRLSEQAQAPLQTQVYLTFPF